MEDRNSAAYLMKRGIKKEWIQNDMLRQVCENTKYRLFTAGDIDFMVSHFLDDSPQPGYGLVATNQILNTEKEQLLAIGLVEGDDVICLVPSNGEIRIWMIQTGNGEKIKAANSLQEFLKMCTEK